MLLRAAILMIACLTDSLSARSAEREAAQPSSSAATPQPVAVAATGQSAFLQGIAKAKLNASLRLAEQGTITAIHVQEGQWVAAGTPILTIDDGAAKAAMIVAKAGAEAHAAADQAELAMKQALTLLTRTRIAFHANASSEFEVATKENLYAQAVATYQLRLEEQLRAQAQLALAEEQLKNRTLCAPFDGRVIQIQASLGNLLDPTQVAAHLAKLDQLEVEMHLPVALFNTVTAGQTRELRAAAPVNAQLKATVVYVAPVVEPTSATFRVVFAINNEDLALPAGFEVWYQ